MTEPLAFFALGAGLLAAGAVVLGTAATRAARGLGAGPFAARLVPAAFAAAAPVLAVGLAAAWKQPPQLELALGTVVGCGTANVGLVLGLAAAVRPVAAGLRLFRTQIPLVIAANLLFWALSGDDLLTRTDGAILMAGFVAWVAVSARQISQIPREAVPPAPAPPAGPVWVTRVLVVAALAVLAVGALVLVAAAVRLHAPLGLGKWTMGLTLLTAAASLPVLAMTLAAARRGQSDVVLANVVGANLVNLLLVMGVLLVLNPVGIGGVAAHREIPAMVLFTVLLVPALVNDLRVSRWEGLVLVLAYAALVTWQVRGNR